MTLTVREVKKPKVQLEFRDKTPINIKQGIETLKEISAGSQKHGFSKQEAEEFLGLLVIEIIAKVHAWS